MLLVMSDLDADLLPQLIDEVLRAQGRLLAATGELAAVDGLTGAQALVLTAVVRAGRPPTVAQIGRSLGRARQSVQRLADLLAARELLVRKENPDDRRAPSLVPTLAGREVYERIERRSRSWSARITDEMDENDLLTTIATLRQLRDRLQDDAARH